MSRLHWLILAGGAGLLATGVGLWITQGQAVWMEGLLAFCL